MKMLTTFLAVFAVSIGLASAQDLSGNANRPASAGSAAGADITGFHSPKELGPTTMKESSKFPNTHPDLRPKLGGVFVDGAKYGTELINPAAPASYGVGEKYLTAPDPRYDLERESGRAAHQDSGGIKLFSLEF
jgi:hypothetical protein